MWTANNRPRYSIITTKPRCHRLALKGGLDYGYAMQSTAYIFMTMLVCAAGLCGCVTSSSDPVEPDAADAAGMGFLEEGLQAEEYLFPVYLLLSGFELKEQGVIAQTPLIGMDMQTGFPLDIARQRLGDVMTANGWSLEPAETGRQSFRLKASNGAETMEIRAVRGTGPTRIFVMYRPDPSGKAER